MNDKTSALSLGMWKKVFRLAKPFFTSQEPWEISVPFTGTKFSIAEKWKAWGLLVSLALLLLGVNLLNIGINFVAGNFQNSLQAFLKAGEDVGKQQLAEATYWKYLFLYGGVFVVGTPIVVFFSWMKSILVVTWRKWLTVHILKAYFSDRNYYKISYNTGVDNPDERIANDVEGFTSGALGITLSVVDSILTFFSFIFILWTISHTLVGVVVLYAGFGTLISVLLSIKLIQLKFNQQKLEADYRFNLIHVRKNVENIAFYQGEGAEMKHLIGRFYAAIKNNMTLLGYSRNVNMFSTAFNYFVIIVPAFFIAPLFFKGEVEIGAFTQSNLAFSQVLGALSLFVAELATISSFAAYVNRLGGFQDAMEAKNEWEKEGRTAIVTKESDKVALNGVTLFTPDGSRMLVKEATVEVPAGTGLIIKGPSGSGKSSLLRAIAGLWRLGEGVIERPAMGARIMFLSQVPGITMGNLRDQLVYPNIRTDITDAEIAHALVEAGLPDLISRYEAGLDELRNWASELSPGEQQRMVFARLLISKPEFVFLDEATSALDVANEERLYRVLRLSKATYVSVGHRPTLDKYHEQCMTLKGDGTGAWEVVEQK